MADNSRILSFPDKDRIKQEAATWVAKCETRPLKPEQYDELGAWLSLSPTHKEEFENLAALWGQLDILDELNYFEELQEKTPILSRVTSITRWEARSLIAAAAVLLCVGLLFSSSIVLGSDGVTVLDKEIYSTQLGEQESVVLADGTSVTLNTDSEIEVVYSIDKRDVYLKKGEAHFDVASDASKPFSVRTHEGIVRAVGTEFSVRLAPEAVEVIVSEGRVELLPNLTFDDVPTNSAIAVAKEKLELAAGDTARFVNTRAELLLPLSETELNRKLSWRRGLLAFAGDPLREVVDEVSRYTDVEIVFVDSDLEQLPIGGYFKAGEVEGLLEAVEQTFDVEVDRKVDGSIYLYSTKLIE